MNCGTLMNLAGPWIAGIHISILRPHIKRKHLSGPNFSGFLFCTSLVSAYNG